MIKLLAALAAIGLLYLAPQASAQDFPQRVNAGSANEVCTPLVVTASSAYTANNEVGGLVTFPSLLRLPVTTPSAAPLSGVLQSVRLTSKSVQTAEFDVTFFSGNPTASTWTDKSAPAITGADILLVEPPIKLTNNFSGLGTHTVYGADGIARSIKWTSTTGYAIVTTPGTPTFTATSDLQLCAAVLQDN